MTTNISFDKIKKTSYGNVLFSCHNTLNLETLEVLLNKCKTKDNIGSKDQCYKSCEHFCDFDLLNSLNISKTRMDCFFQKNHKNYIPNGNKIYEVVRNKLSNNDDAKGSKTNFKTRAGDKLNDILNIIGFSKLIKDEKDIIVSSVADGPGAWPLLLLNNVNKIKHVFGMSLRNPKAKHSTLDWYSTLVNKHNFTYSYGINEDGDLTNINNIYSFIELIDTSCSKFKNNKQVKYKFGPMTTNTSINKKKQIEQPDFNNLNYYNLNIDNLETRSQRNINKYSIIIDKESFSFNYHNKKHVFLSISDGGIDVSGDENFQECNNILLKLSEFFFHISILKQNGIFISKIYNTNSKTMVTLIYVTTLLFENVQIIKPKNSRIVNDEKYIVCFGFRSFNNPIVFKKFSSYITQIIQKLKEENSFDKTIVKLFDISKISSNVNNFDLFVNKFRTFNIEYTKIQKNRINEIMDIAIFISKILHYDTKYNTFKYNYDSVTTNKMITQQKIPKEIILNIIDKLIYNHKNIKK